MPASRSALRIRWFLPPVMLTLLIISCSDTPTRPPRRTLPRSLTSQESLLIESDNLFGLNLFSAVNVEDAEENVFISPLSVAMALGMTLNGAQDSTRTAMEETLELAGLTEEEINQAYRTLIDLLVDLDPRVTFQIANSIWYRLGFPINPAFVDLNETYFDSEVNELDFGLPEAADIINSWVKEKTQQKIETIVDPPIPDAVVMYLINAIYFKGTWLYQFDESETADAPFHLADGSTRQVSMMTLGESSLPYYVDDEVRIVDLSYGDSLYTMTVILPQPDVDINELIASLDQAKWSGWIDGLYETTVDLLRMPKYRLEYKKSLRNALSAMGMEVAFDPVHADFHRMWLGGLGNLFISDVLHKTFIEIDERGTEAAAVTAVIIEVTSIPETLELVVDRPFLFAIRERQSGTILFMGKILDPPAN